MHYKNIEKHIDNSIRHVEKKKDEFEGHQTKASSSTIRNNMIANQKRHNDDNEYERLICVLTNTAIIHLANRDQLENRRKQLENLGARAAGRLNGNKKQTHEQIISETGDDDTISSASFYSVKIVIVLLLYYIYIY